MAFAPNGPRPDGIPSTPIDFSLPIDTAALKGSNALVTGGVSGLGKGIVEAMLAAGASVTVADVNESLGNALVSQLHAAGHSKVQFVKTDAKDYDSQLAAFKAAWNFSCTSGEDGHIDIVIPSAGITGGTILAEAVPEKLPVDADPPKPDLSCLEINLLGVYYSAVLALHYFNRSNKTGGPSSTRPRQILLISSMAGYSEMPWASQYASSKWAVRGLFKSIRNTTHAYGGNIRVNLFAPWWVKTPMTTTILERLKVVGPSEVEDAVAGMMRVLCDGTIHGRAIATGKTGPLYGKEFGAFNFDLGDDLTGLDGGQEFAAMLKAKWFGPGVEPPEDKKTA